MDEVRLCPRHVRAVKRTGKQGMSDLLLPRSLQARFARFARIATFFDGAYRGGMTANRMKQGGLAANPSISLLMCQIANKNTHVYNSTFVLLIQE